MKYKHGLAYMRTAEAFAQCSDSTRLKVGAVIVKDNNVISTGYNALPEALDGSLEDDNGQTRPEVRHAEENALKRLIRRNENTDETCSMFATHACCIQCAIDIVDSGISTFYFNNFYRSHDGLKHLLTNGVTVYRLNTCNEFKQLRLEDFTKEN